MHYRVAPLDESQARRILCWRYPPPYDFYNPPVEGDPELVVQAFLDPSLCFHGISSQGGEFVGFCSFGEDGRVPGGNYGRDALDIGLGMKPSATGRGLGREFVTAITDFATTRFSPDCLRMTVADFNTRALRLYHNCGFQICDRFIDPAEHVAYSILILKTRGPVFVSPTGTR